MTQKINNTVLFAALTIVASAPALAQLPDPGFVIDPERTALVVTDPQNDFLSPDGVTWGVVGKSVTGEDAGYARVAVGKGQQQHEHLLAAQRGGSLFVQNDLDTAEKGILDELDQSLEHLGFAGEMAVESRFGYTDLAG